MKRLLILLCLIAPALACNLGSAAPTPTSPPPTAPIFSQPTLALSPVVGPPGTTITLVATGFPAGAAVNLFISTVSKPSTVPTTAITIGTSGTLTFTLQVPTTVDNAAVASNTPLVFTLTAAAGSPGASALFLALSAQPGQPTLAVIATSAGTGSTGGTANDLFITSPGIDSLQNTGTVIVTGSGSSASSSVTVQVQNSANQVLGSATAAIAASPGFVGVWQTTIAFTPPASGTGFIAAFTSDGKQASIPIYFSGAAPVGNTTVPQVTFPTLAAPTALFGGQ